MSLESNEQKLKLSKRRRLEFIESRLFWEGRVSRKDLTDYYHISVPQATKDIKDYTERYPENITYDTGIKAHIAKERFCPQLIEPDSNKYRDQLLIHFMEEDNPFYFGNYPSFYNLPELNRPVEPKLLRKITKAISSKESVKITYHSMDSGKSTRWVSPHALVFDGYRLHMRAYCYAKESFRDFNLGRVLSVEEESYPSNVDFNLDYLWESSFDAVILPHPELNNHQRECIESEYRMDGGKLIVSFRAAFLYYFYRKHGFDVKDYQKGETIPPEKQQIVLENQKEIDDQKTLLEKMSIKKLVEAAYTAPDATLQELK